MAAPAPVAEEDPAAEAEEPAAEEPEAAEPEEPEAPPAAPEAKKLKPTPADKAALMGANNASTDAEPNGCPQQ